MKCARCHRYVSDYELKETNGICPYCSHDMLTDEIEENQIGNQSGEKFDWSVRTDDNSYHKHVDDLKNQSFTCRKCGNLVYIDQLKSYTLCPYCAHDIISDEEIKCGNCGKKVDSEYLRVCGGRCQYCDAAIWVNDGKNCSSINDDSFWEYPKIHQNDEELHSDVSSQNEEKFDWSVRTDSNDNTANVSNYNQSTSSKKWMIFIFGLLVIVIIAAISNRGGFNEISQEKAEELAEDCLGCSDIHYQNHRDGYWTFAHNDMVGLFVYVCDECGDAVTNNDATDGNDLYGYDYLQEWRMNHECFR